MLRILLMRAGSTDLDEQGRIKGTLDVPLNDHGSDQAVRAAQELADCQLQKIYVSPCQSALQTAGTLAERLQVRTKKIDDLRNLDRGLWHGKMIEEVRRQQPKVYRQWLEHPETVCPPEGETLAEALQRIRRALNKILRKHKQGEVALVTPEPLASLIRSLLQDSELGDLWEAECGTGFWEWIDIESPRNLAV